MNFKKYSFFILLLFITHSTIGQIKNLNDVIIKTEKLKMLTQRLAKNYIMKGILPNDPKIKKQLKEDNELFTNNLLELTENALNEEIEIEFQKLNLSWMLMNRILQQKYDGASAVKIIKYAEKMNNEIEIIRGMISKTTKLKSVMLLSLSSEGNTLSQQLILYYIAYKAKLRYNEIPDKFEQTKAKLYKIIKILQEQSQKDPDLKTDEGIQMYVEMIKSDYDKQRKNITLKSNVHPKTANMIINKMSENFELLTNIIYEKFN